MPLPMILTATGVITSVAGISTGIYGVSKMKDANDTIKSAESRHQRNIDTFEIQNKITTTDMDNLGKKELEILNSFETFSDIIEQIQGRPEFKRYNKENIDIPKYDKEELKKVSIGAGVLLGGIGSAALGTAGGFAAAGATTSAVMALGTASTGTAIASLSGAAATNATLAALGGGAIAAGGGGIALGTTVLGAATLGVGLLVGGIIFGVAGKGLSEKADEAWSQMKKAESQIEEICTYLENLSNIAKKYNNSLLSVEKIYKNHLNKLNEIVTQKRDWYSFTKEEKLVTENTVLLVGLLYNMCKVKLVLQTDDENELNKINEREITRSIKNTKSVISDLTIPYSMY